MKEGDGTQLSIGYLDPSWCLQPSANEWAQPYLCLTFPLASAEMQSEQSKNGPRLVFF